MDSRIRYFSISETIVNYYMQGKVKMWHVNGKIVWCDPFTPACGIEVDGVLVVWELIPNELDVRALAKAIAA